MDINETKIYKAQLSNFRQCQSDGDVEGFFGDLAALLTSIHQCIESGDLDEAKDELRRCQY